MWIIGDAKQHGKRTHSLAYANTFLLWYSKLFMRKYLLFFSNCYCAKLSGRHSMNFDKLTRLSIWGLYLVIVRHSKRTVEIDVCFWNKTFREQPQPADAETKQCPMHNKFDCGCDFQYVWSAKPFKINQNEWYVDMLSLMPMFEFQSLAENRVAA